jgi:hypothetical protein
MITERTLRKWRKEALGLLQSPENLSETYKEVLERILRLTQELLDQHLIRKPTR